MKIIPLTQGQFALVDDEDYDRINQFNWYACKRIKKTGVMYYAVVKIQKNKVRKTFYMHNMIFGILPNHEIDHIDCNPLNNQKHNLRFVTKTQNQQNRNKSEGMTSKFKGVYFYNKKFRSCIVINGEKKHLGSFSSELDAAKKYNEVAIKTFGEYANINNY